MIFIFLSKIFSNMFNEKNENKRTSWIICHFRNFREKTHAISFWVAGLFCCCIVYKNWISTSNVSLELWRTQNFLPDNTWSPIREILFLVKISLTILVMLEKAPFWISVIKLLVRFTDKSLVCVENTSGVRRSEKKKYIY